MNNILDIDIAWGGYYASVSSENGEVSGFRLLDFNRDAYHAALYSEKFSQLPTLDQVQNLSPFVGHAPIDAKGLLNRDNLQLIDGKPLGRDDLAGYICYLEAHDVPQEDIDGLVNEVIEYSQESPLPLRLQVIAGELVISERE